MSQTTRLMNTCHKSRPVLPLLCLLLSCLASTAQEPSSTVHITFAVDMALEEVAPDGIFISAEPMDWELIPMENTNGNVWTATLDLPFNYEVLYHFLNGSEGLEPSQNLKLCGIADGFGGFYRSFITPFSDVELTPDCFGRCGSCDLVPAKEKPRETIKIFPNPVSDHCTILFPSYYGNEISIEVRDLAGKCLFQHASGHLSSDQYTVNMSDWPAGTYLFLIPDRLPKLVVKI